MNGCGEDWCASPWEGLLLGILLAWGWFGRENYTGSPYPYGNGGGG